MPSLDFTSIWPVVQVVLEPLWPYAIVLAGVAGGITVFSLVVRTLRS